MFVEIRHDVFAAVYGGRGAISIELRDAMTTEPGHIVFVDNFGMSRVVVVVSGCEERLEVCHQKERDGVLFFLVGEFQLTILGVRILDLLRRVLEIERNVSFESCWVVDRVEATVTRVWNDRIWICVPLNGTCWLRTRNGVLWCLRAAEDLRGVVCLFRDSDILL